MPNDPAPQFVRHLYVTLSTSRTGDAGSINADADADTDAGRSDHASASLTWDDTAPQRFVVHSTPALLNRILETRRGGFGCSTVATFMRKLQVHGFRRVDDRRTCHAPQVCGVFEYARGAFYRGCFATDMTDESTSYRSEATSMSLSIPSSVSATTDCETISTPECSRVTEENDHLNNKSTVDALTTTDTTALPQVEIVDNEDDACRDLDKDPRAPQVKTTAELRYNVGAWSEDEHARYLEAMASASRGIGKWSWKQIAEQVGTRSARQVMTHHQKYLAKQRRRQSQQPSPTPLTPPPPPPADNLSILVLASTMVSQENYQRSTGPRQTAATRDLLGRRARDLSRGDATDTEDDEADDKDDPFGLHDFISGTFRSVDGNRVNTTGDNVSRTSEP
ncbi:hypothetical protein PINS_up000693 [Pythium insidiosum]|nr:hypothetical protein PINS_up000693 [Pythium insidiosum]